MGNPYLEPDTELDAIVAKHVFGSNVQPVEKAWTLQDWSRSDYVSQFGGLGILPGPRPDAQPNVGWCIPQYSTDYDDLEDLVDKLAQEWFISICCTPHKEYPWHAIIFRSHGPKEQGEPDDEEFIAYGRTLPHAIALVAAKAYGWKG